MILLNDGPNGGVGTSAALALQGCYLHYDVNDGFIRSGKATSAGKSFKSRLQQHGKAAKLLGEADIRSTFYTSYPSKEARVETKKTRLAYYEDLQVFCGAAFASDADPSTLFHWSAISKCRIEKLSWKGELYDKKCLHIVGYLLELAYDLCIPSTTNISRNPGFETILAIF